MTPLRLGTWPTEDYRLSNSRKGDDLRPGNGVLATGVVALDSRFWRKPCENEWAIQHSELA